MCNLKNTANNWDSASPRIQKHWATSTICKVNDTFHTRWNEFILNLENHVTEFHINTKHKGIDPRYLQCHSEMGFAESGDANVLCWIKELRPLQTVENHLWQNTSANNCSEHFNNWNMYVCPPTKPLNFVRFAKMKNRFSWEAYFILLR